MSEADAGSPFAGAPEGLERKRVSIVFTDLVGSTELGERLDPEVLRLVLDRYHAAVIGTVERHGGVVEKLMGDGVLAVFGVPTVHEDDALRAARAALEVRETLRALGEQAAGAFDVRLEVRIGVNTGEVLVGTSELLGDAVNTAKRLEEAAEPGEILLDTVTVALARGALEVDPAGELRVKGKAETVSAYRLAALRDSDAGGRGSRQALVGRSRELALLLEAFRRTVEAGTCHLFTLLGPAGIGKSRLAEEFLSGIEGATVVRGRCPSYGEGVTYRPLVEAVKPLLGDEPASRLSDLGLDASARAGVLSLLTAGLPLASAGATARGVLALFEAVARAAPLVAVFDDIHWAEPGFLDLVDHVTATSREAPVLVLCLARPELFERRPGWGGGKPNTASLLLEPLSRDEAAQLLVGLDVLALVSPEARERILAEAEGNPFFLEEMVAFVSDTGPDAMRVPPTVQALLAARIDRLPADERAVLSAAAVVGRDFDPAAVEVLARQGDVAAPLVGLLRKGLLAAPPGEAYRFRHALLRDAAYGALPKAARASYHETLAGWFDGRAPPDPDRDELVGFHLEQAHRYRVELTGRGDPATETLAAHAAERLGLAASRAESRNDLHGVVHLLERIREVRGGLELGHAIELVHAHRQLGDLSAADREAVLALDRAVAAGDRRGELRARLARSEVALDPDQADAVPALAREAAEVFALEEDWEGLAEAELALGLVEYRRSRFAAVVAVVEPALEHARRAGRRRLERRALGILAGSHIYGPTPVAKAIPWLEAHLEAVDHHTFFLDGRAFLEAARGEFDRARELQCEAGELRRQLGLPAVNSAGPRWLVAMLAGELEEAAAVAAGAVDHWERHGERGYRSTVAAELALSLSELGRDDEAERWARTAGELAAPDDALTHAIWRQALAPVLARRGRTEDAVRHAREAVEVARRAQVPDTLAGALVSLARILREADSPDEAVAALEEAVRLYGAKGNVVAEGRARALRESWSR